MKNVILAVIIIILIGGLAYWQMNKPLEEQIVENINQSEQSDWLTYRNEEYGIEFQYDDDWLFDKIQPINPDNVVYSGRYYIINDKPNNPSISKIIPKMQLVILNNPKGDDSVKTIERYNNFGEGTLDDFFEKDINIDGRELKIYNIPGHVVLPALVFNHKGFTFEVIYNLDDNDFNHYINSFKFID